MTPTVSRSMFTTLAHLAVGFALACAAVVSAAAPKPGYGYYLRGSAVDQVLSGAPASPMTVLMGGGPDVDEAFVRMIDKARGGTAQAIDFVVIRASGADDYNALIATLGGSRVDSVETLVITSREAANDPFVIDRVAKAEAIFIAGGDQSNYIEDWKGTALDTTLRAAIAANVPLGGTSAGLAVLGQFDFAALNGTISSDEALKNPFSRRMTLDRGFLTGAGLDGVIADAHLDTRDRMGRLMVFLARLVQDGWGTALQVHGIGVDVETALVVDNGVYTRLGLGSVYLLQPTMAPTLCQPKQPLTFRNVTVDRLSPGGSVRYDLSAEGGVLYSSQAGGAIY